MKKFLLLLTALLTTASSTLWAVPISESKARAIAANFMASRAKQLTPLRKARKAPKTTVDSTETTAAYYVFNAEEGYVIVAGDDRAPAVLGYSDEGVFNDDDVPEAMQAMLDGYAAQITALEQGAQSTDLRSSGAAIAPLVKCQWAQGAPYNTLMPTLSSGEHAVAGCVATALAQVMAYWKWPACPTRSLPEYTSETLLFYMPELPVVDFQWNLLQNTYERTDTESDAAKAAATINLYCAQALTMDFKESSSGTNTSSIPVFAAAYFDYDAAAHMENRLNYSTQGWADLIYGELEAGHPVIYSGSKKNGGHAFICDGYDGNGLFHINWGWNGQSNGYFLLNVLNPDEQGTGSVSGAYGYIMSQAVIVGLQPNKGGSNAFEVTSSNIVLNSFVNTRSDTDGYFIAKVSGAFRNYTSDTLAVRLGWGVFEDGALIDWLYSSRVDQLRPGYYVNHSDKELFFGEDITSGTYRILPMYCEIGTDNWRPCVGADHNYIEVTIDGNQCTLTGYGTAGVRDYTINDIATTSPLYNGRPININVNLTNNGEANNHYLYMFVDGKFSGTGFVGLETGETGDISYPYLSTEVGDHTFTWSWNDNGSDPIATRTFTISQMPAANLSATLQVLNVTDASGYVITSDKFSVVLTITNVGTTTYDEDIIAKMFKHTTGSSGTGVQGISQHLTLAAGESTTMQFDMTNLCDGWKYFVRFFCYSEGNQVRIASTSFHTIVFPEEPAPYLSANVMTQNIEEDSDGNKYILDDQFSISLTILNESDVAYDDNVTAVLYENIGTSNVEVQRVSRQLTLGEGENAVMDFDMTNVIDGHTYHVCSYFYFKGEKTLLASTPPLTIIFPVVLGDVNGDTEITIADVTTLVNIILGKDTTGYNLRAADVNQDGATTIADVTALVNIILGK